MIKKQLSEPQQEPLIPFAMTKGDVLHHQSLKVSRLKNNTLKVRPPFYNLSAFNVDAVILSFLGYEDEIFALLTLLDHNSSLYGMSHKEYLRPFLVKYQKEITQTLQFRADIAKSISAISARKTIEESVSIN